MQGETYIFNGTRSNNTPIMVDARVYIADSGNNRIIMVDARGNITTVAGNGSYGYSGDGGLATSAELRHPSAVCFYPGDVYYNATIYIADTENHVIRKVNNGTGIITTVAGTGIPGFGGSFIYRQSIKS